jgi:hypothetical protein
VAVRIASVHPAAVRIAADRIASVRIASVQIAAVHPAAAGVRTLGRVSDDDDRIAGHRDHAAERQPAMTGKSALDEGLMIGAEQEPARSTSTVRHVERRLIARELEAVANDCCGLGMLRVRALDAIVVAPRDAIVVAPRNAMVVAPRNAMGPFGAGTNNVTNLVRTNFGSTHIDRAVSGSGARTARR